MTLVWPIVWAALAAQSPDSATKHRYLAALQAVDDSLSSVRAAGANFRADLAAASPELIVARSTRMRDRCAGARAALARLDTVLAVAYSPRAGEPQRALRAESVVLAGTMRRCERDWNPAPRVAADSLRAWGPFRVEQLDRAMRRYTARAVAFRNRTALK